MATWVKWSIASFTRRQWRGEETTQWHQNLEAGLAAARRNGPTPKDQRRAERSDSSMARRLSSSAAVGRGGPATRTAPAEGDRGHAVI